MLKHAADLSNDHEYFIVWAGGRNARPWGAKADAYKLFPDLELAPEGVGPITLDVSGSGSVVSCSTFPAGVTVAENEFAGATIRIGTTVSGGFGYGTILSHPAMDSLNTPYTIDVAWAAGNTAADATDQQAYIVRENVGLRQRAYRPQVRVLTPYQPVAEASSSAAVIGYPVTTAGGRAVTLPAPYALGLADIPTVGFEDLGVLLPLTHFEGINGFGISDVDDSIAGGPTTHRITDVASTGTVFTFENALLGTNYLAGGYVIVDWTNGGNAARSWGLITASSTTTFTVSWASGDGPPPDGSGAPYATIVRYTAWVPHFDDSPFAFLPGEGFTYPNHDMMPYAGAAAAGVQNRPRGITAAYGDTFGALVVAALRLSSATGQTINVVNLGLTDTRLSPTNDRNGSGFPGEVGWYNPEEHATWAPTDPFSAYQRLEYLLQTVLPNALAIDQKSTTPAHTRTLRCLGIVWAQGEADAAATGARQQYGRMLTQLSVRLRKLITTLGYNPYDDDAELPFVQPRIAFYPNAIDGTYGRDADRGGGSVALDADTQNLVNAAIEEHAAVDEFKASVRVDDLPRLSTDYSLYNGVGEAELGSRVGDTLSDLVDRALSYGSDALDTPRTTIVDICNLALGNIGDAGQLNSLTDGSEQAIQCERFLPEARDELLSMAQWGFATRRRQLVAIATPEPGLYQHFNYCYVMPAEAWRAFRVYDSLDLPTSEDFVYTDVVGADYEDEFVSNEGASGGGLQVTPVPPAQVFPGDPGGGGGGVSLTTSRLLPLVSTTQQTPKPFVTEQSPNGARYIYTNVPSATLQYVAKVVDASVYPPLFASALAAQLASKLASHFVKGNAGEAVSGRMLAKAAGYMNQAEMNDALAHHPVDGDGPFEFIPDHLGHR